MNTGNTKLKDFRSWRWTNWLGTVVGELFEMAASVNIHG